MRHVVGQDPGGVDEREGEHRDDDAGEGAHEVAPDPGEAQQRPEGGHGGQDPEGGREEHLPHSLDGRRLDARLREGDVALHVLSHHDGVVDHDAEGQDEPEQAEHVHGDPEPGHHQERAEEGHRKSGGGPDREPARQREEENEEDEGQALQPVPDEDVHAALEELPGIEPGGHGDPFRHGPFDVADLGMHRLRGFEEPGPTRQHHLEERRGLTVHARRPLDIRETVGDDRHVPDRDHAAAGDGDQGDPGEVLPGDRFRLRADPQFAAVGPDGAARHVRGAPADRHRDLVERQTEPGEDVFRDLDRDLVVPARGDLHRRHPGDRGERVPDPVRRLGETALVGVPVDRYPQQQGIHPQLRDHRFFGVRR